MTSGWTTSADELLLAVDTSSPRKGEQLRLALRQAVADGVLRPGTRLPSSRSLAADRGMARGVVVDVYEQLTAEGWLAARQGSGTVVAAHPSSAGARREPADRQSATFDLRPAQPDVVSFPRSAWLGATRSVLAELPHAGLGYGDHRGHAHVREVVAGYLARVRGVRSEPELVLMSNGFSAALGTVVAGLAAHGVGRIAVEDPGGYEPRGVVQAAGGEVLPIPVDDHGLQVEALERSDAQAVLVTPAHQYPMGHVLGPERRMALAAWARRTGGWIIEDDYDAEFRYDREPVGAVQGLVPDRTIHVGSVAKTLAPSIRVGWIVAPAELQRTFTDVRHARESQQATLEHLVVARLVEEGRYDRHLRKVRRLYRERRDTLLETLTDEGLDDRVQGVAAGLHAVIRLDDAADDLTVAAAARARSVEVVALSRYAIAAPARGLVVGFGQRAPKELRRGLELLADVIRADPGGV
jgi:GntR family transcriptional regulator / MocR family aminotransferase